MPARAFSIEDGNANIKSLIGARKASYTDIDLAFANKPAGDIFKKTNAAAVKQAVKNLLMTNQMEKPFDTTFGGNLSDFIFENDTEIDLVLIIIMTAKFLIAPAPQAQKGLLFIFFRLGPGGEVSERFAQEALESPPHMRGVAQNDL